MKNIKLGLRQIIYENKAFRRNPASAFFTFILPLLFLFILNIILGNNPVESSKGMINLSTMYIPTMAAFSIINSSYTSIAMNLSISRDRGLLKRIKGTPLPKSSFLFGKIAHNTLISATLIIIIIIVGELIFDVRVPRNNLPALFIVLLLGTATFCSLGIAVASLIPNADASPAIVNASILPLLFISEVFIPMHNAPSWLNLIAQIFPVRPLSISLQEIFNPSASGLVIGMIDLLVLCSWLTLGIISSMRYFSWDPKG